MNHPAVSLSVLLLVATCGASAAELAGTLKKIHDSGTITLGVREASIPFSYLDDRQQSVGYSVDLCNKVVEAVRKELKMPNLKVEKQVVTSATRVPLSRSANTRLVAAHSPWRREFPCWCRSAMGCSMRTSCR